MPQQLICTQGHRWLAPHTKQAAGAGECPVCGSPIAGVVPAPELPEESEEILDLGEYTLKANSAPVVRPPGGETVWVESGEEVPPPHRDRDAQGFQGVIDMTLPPQDTPATYPGEVLDLDEVEGAELQEQGEVPGYEILCELGRGGMGVVYKARQLSLGRVVALKMILTGGHASDADLARFQAEAEAVAQLMHPNIVQIYDIGDHDGLPYFSLEYVDGGSLAERLEDEEGPTRPEIAARMIRALAQAVEHAHRHDIVHRDLKPANVLLSTEASDPLPASGGLPSVETTIPPYGTPKIADFGLAKRLDNESGQTRSGTIVGTPAYMAPEQASGKKEIGPAADVYALGAMFYELLTGRPPFKGPNALDTVLMVISNPPVPPSQMRPGIPADLEMICLKCLEKDPGNRYASAQALADDLGCYLAGEAVSARRAPLRERVIRWARKRPAQAVLTSILALAVLLGLSWLFPSSWRLLANRGVVQLTVEGDQTALTFRRLRLDDPNRPGPERTVTLGGDHSLWLRAGLYEIEPARGEEKGGPSYEIVPAGFRLSRNGTVRVEVRLRKPGLVRSLSSSVPAERVALTPDGRLAVTANPDGKVSVYHVPSGRLLRTVGEIGAVGDVAVSPDGKEILCANRGDLLLRWDLATGLELSRHTTRWLGPGTNLIAVVHRGKEAFGVGRNGALYRWDLRRRGEEAQEPSQVYEGHTVPAQSLAISPDGRWAASGGEDGLVLIWDLDSSSSGPQHVLQGHNEGTGSRPVFGVAFSPDSRRLASVGADRTVRVWDARSGLLLRRMVSSSGKAARAVAWLPQKDDSKGSPSPYRWLATTGEDGGVRLWDTRSGVAGPLLLGEKTEGAGTGRGSTITGLAVRADGLYAVTARATRPVDSTEDFLQWWALPRNPSSGTEGGSPLDNPAVGVPEGGAGVAFPERNSEMPAPRPRDWGIGTSLALGVSPDGRWAVTGHEDRRVRVWDLVRGEEHFRLAGGSKAIRGVGLTDELIVGAGLGGNVRIWDRKTGQERGSPLAGSPISDLLVAAGGQRAVAVSENTVRVLDLAGPLLLGTLPPFTAPQKLALSADGLRLITGAGDSVSSWPLDSKTLAGGVIRATWTYNLVARSKVTVQALGVSPDGRRVVVATSDGALRQLDELGAEMDSRPYETHGNILNLAVSGEGGGPPGKDKGLAPPLTLLVALREGVVLRLSSKEEGGRPGAGRPPDEGKLEGGGAGSSFRLTGVAQVPPVPAPAKESTLPVTLPLAAVPGTSRFLVLEHSGQLHRFRWVEAKEVGNTPPAPRAEPAPRSPQGEEVLRFTGHRSGVLTAAFSADGQKVIAGAGHVYLNGRWGRTGPDMTARIFDRATGKELQRLEGHTAMVCAVAFSPDGKTCATGSADRLACIWDTKTGGKLHDLRGNTNDIRCVRYSRDGKLLLTAGGDGVARLWTVATGTEAVRLPLTGNARPATAGGETTAFHFWSGDISPDDRQILLGVGTGNILLWDVPGRKIVNEWKGHTNTVREVRFSSDGKRFWSASYDGWIRCWETATQKELPGAIHVRHGILSMGIAQDRWAIVSGWAGALTLVDLEKTEIVHRFSGHVDPVHGADISRDGRWVASAGMDRTVRIWRMPEEGKPLPSPQGQGKLLILAEAPAGRIRVRSQKDRKVVAEGEARFFRLPAGSYTLEMAEKDPNWRVAPPRLEVKTGEQTLARLWRLSAAPPTFPELIHRMQGQGAKIRRLHILPDGKHVVTGSHSSSIRQDLFVLWNLEKGKEVRRFTSSGQAAYALASTPDGKHLFTGGDDRAIRVWELPSGRLVKKLLGHPGSVYDLAVSPDGKSLLSFGPDAGAYVWDWEKGTIRTRFKEHKSTVDSGTFTPDGKEIITGSSGQTIRWEADTGRVVWTKDWIKNTPSNLIVTPDGKKLLASSWGGGMILAEAESGKELKRWTVSAPVTGLGLAPDGRHFVTGERSGKVKFWSMDQDAPLREITASNEGLLHLGVTRDGRRIVVAGGDVNWDWLRGTDFDVIVLRWPELEKKKD